MFEFQIEQANDLIRRSQACAENGYQAVPQSQWVSSSEISAWYSATEALIVDGFGQRSSAMERYLKVRENRNKLMDEAIAMKDPKWDYNYWIFHFQEMNGLLRALEAQYRSLHPELKEIIMGNKIVVGNVTGAIVNIDSTLNQVTQKIGAAGNIDEGIRQTLTALVEQLKSELGKVPVSSTADAEAVADSAKALVEAGTKPQPNKRTIQITANGLKEAAEGLANIMPSVLGIASNIIKIVSQVHAAPLF